MNVSSLKADAASFGWPLAISVRVVRRILDAIRVELVMVRATPIDLERPAPPLPDSIDIRELSADDLRAAAGDAEMELKHEFVEASLVRGDHVFGAYEGPLLVAYLVRTTSAAPHVDGISVRVDKPYAYLYKSFARPSHRGMRLTPNLMLFSDRTFFDMGYTHRCGFIHICNVASIRAARHIGSRFLGYAGYARWFGRLLTFRTSPVRRVGFEFFSDDTYLPKT